MTKPIWLLDIDGVVNSLSNKAPRYVWPLETWHKIDVADTAGISWPILYSTEVIDRINAVHDSGLAEVRWHTTWQESALNFADAVGLRGFYIADAPEFENLGQYTAQAILNCLPTWWKFPAALRVLQEEGRPLIWTDDDVETGLRNYEWPEGLPDRLILPIRGTEGLKSSHFGQITSFCSLNS